MPDTERFSLKLDGIKDQITELAESFNAQLRSLTATIHANTMEIGNRVTTLERDFAGHLLRDSDLHKAIEEKLTEGSNELEHLSVQLGQEVGGLANRLGEQEERQRKRAEEIVQQGSASSATIHKRIDEHQAVFERAKGAATVWRILMAVVGVGVAVLEFLYHGGP